MRLCRGKKCYIKQWLETITSTRQDLLRYRNCSQSVFHRLIDIEIIRIEITISSTTISEKIRDRTRSSDNRRRKFSQNLKQINMRTLRKSRQPSLYNLSLNDYKRIHNRCQNSKQNPRDLQQRSNDITHDRHNRARPSVIDNRQHLVMIIMH